MMITEKAIAISTKPKETWPAVAAEQETVQSLFAGYIMPLAAIGPIASFIGLSLIGVNVFGISYRVPVANGLVNAVVTYILGLVGCYVSAMIASELAPNFGGSKNVVQGLKLVAYASTPVWIASVVQIFPPLAIIVLIAGLYSLYVLYLGVTPTMNVGADKQVVYTLILIVVTVVIFVIIGAVVAALRGAAGVGIGM